MTVEYKFPEGFWWGTATSGPQSEGAADIDGRKMSIWDYWYKEEPERFFDNVGPQDTSTFYANYKEDIKLLKETGHNSFRTSIQWSRLIPDGVGEVDNVETLKETVRVRIKDGDIFKQKRYEVKDIKVIKDVKVDEDDNEKDELEEN